jgi:hypothetical protein
LIKRIFLWEGKMTNDYNIETIIHTYEFNLVYANDLVKDIDESIMYKSFSSGLENHPAFILGHLVVASAMVLEDLGGSCELPDGWNKLFSRSGPGDPRLPQGHSENSPLKSELLTELENNHEKVSLQLSQLENSVFAKPLQWRFERMLPTLGDYITFMCVTHEAMHLGQLSAWRRAANLESSLARL